MIITRTLNIVMLAGIMLLLTGCFSLNVEQRLLPNGHYDLIFVFSADQDSSALLQGFQTTFVPADAVKDRTTIARHNNSLIYTFRDIDPATDAHLLVFSSHPGNSTTENQSIASLGVSNVANIVNISFLDPENTHLTRTLRWPYYVYTYELLVGSPSNGVRTGPLLQEDYVIDETNMLSPNARLTIANQINDIYTNDSIDVIVLLKGEMASADSTAYKADFINHFPYRNKNKHYVLVSVMPIIGQQTQCHVESNLYGENQYSLFITSLDHDFSQGCANIAEQSVLDIMQRLDDYSRLHDLNTTAQDTAEQQLLDLFKVDYVVVPFGEIMSSSGTQLPANRVEFTIDSSSSGSYNVTFREPWYRGFLHDPIVIGAFVILLLALIGILAYRGLQRKKHHHHSQHHVHDSIHHVPVPPTLLEYVHKARKYGMKDDQIRASLQRVGWMQKDIESAMSHHKR